MDELIRQHPTEYRAYYAQYMASKAKIEAVIEQEDVGVYRYHLSHPELGVDNRERGTFGSEQAARESARIVIDLMYPDIAPPAPGSGELQIVRQNG